MHLNQVKTALGRTYDGVQRKHTMQMAAGLSYYFVMSLFPLLIVFAALVAYMPVTNLFEQAVTLMARFVPPDGMGLVRAVLRDVITPLSGPFFRIRNRGYALGGFRASLPG
jgi:uncharacterized BrkB/YihY/UPF0761 family membrane protein